MLAVRSILNIVYSAFIGIIAYLYVPKFYMSLWQSTDFRNTGPLIILILVLAAGLYYAAALPNYYISKYLPTAKVKGSKFTAVICGFIAGAPLAVMSLINWLGTGVGGSFSGLMIVAASGPVLGYCVIYHIVSGSADDYVIEQDKKVFKDVRENAGDTVKLNDPIVEMKRNIEMINLSKTKNKDIADLIKRTETPVELKMIIKSYPYEPGFSNYVQEPAQNKLRSIERYSSDEYYCLKCDKTVKSEKRNFRTSDTGRSYYDIKCPECGHKLGEGIDYID